MPRDSLSAFFIWVSREFDLPSPLKAVPSPKVEEPPIEPFTKEEVEALLKACETSKEVNDLDRRKFAIRRSTAKRDQALIMMLLDTGLRASELCALRIGDVDLKTGKVQAKHGRVAGMTLSATRLADGAAATTLIGELADQSALMGVLNALHDLGLPLVSVECAVDEAEGQ
jgi:integrase